MPSIIPQRLEGFGIKPFDQYECGIYGFPRAYVSTIAVLNELPIQPSTLWLRLLARDSVQRQAMEEVKQLDHPLRNRALRHLKQWYQLLQSGRVGQECQRLMQSLAQLECHERK